MRRRRANFEITMPDQEAVNFKALFESAPQLYLVLTPNLNIVADFTILKEFLAKT